MMKVKIFSYRPDIEQIEKDINYFLYLENGRFRSIELGEQFIMLVYEV